LIGSGGWRRVWSPTGHLRPVASAPELTRYRSFMDAEQNRFCYGLHSPHAKFSHTSTALDGHLWNSDVGIEPLFAGTNSYSRTVESVGMVCDGDRSCSTDRGNDSIQAGAHYGQPTQARNGHGPCDLRRICVDPQSYVPRSVNSACRLGHQARYVERTCRAAAVHPAHPVCPNSRRGTRTANAVRRGLRSILPSSESLVRPTSAFLDPLVQRRTSCAALVRIVGQMWSLNHVKQIYSIPYIRPPRSNEIVPARVLLLWVSSASGLGASH
jgi:hypothetical protein